MASSLCLYGLERDNFFSHTNHFSRHSQAAYIDCLMFGTYRTYVNDVIRYTCICTYMHTYLTCIVMCLFD